MRRLIFFTLGVLITSIIHAQPQDQLINNIKKNGQIKFCIWPEFQQRYDVNKKSEAVKILDVDMALHFSKELAVKPNFITSSPDIIVEQLIKGVCDVAMYGIPITDTMSKLIRFTKPVFVTDLYAITNQYNRRIKTWDDLKASKSIILIKKNSSYEAMVRARFKDAKVQSVNFDLLTENAVESGRADAIITDYLDGKNMFMSKEWTKILMPPQIYQRTLYAYASRLDAPVLGERLDKFVKDVKRDGRLVEAAKTHQLESLVVTR